MDGQTKKTTISDEPQFVDGKIYRTQSDTADAHVSLADGALVGQTIARRYRIDSIIGYGGMGIVYRAHDNLLNQDIALKMLHTHLLQESHLMRFRQEARATKRLSHPGIVRVFDFGVEDNGRPFISMEYAQGTTLSKLLENGPLSAERSLKIGKQVAEAIKYAHEQGVLHRDLKPSNIIIHQTNDGEIAQILDFGIAKVVAGDKEEATALTQTGETLGSPLYMSPEQCQGGAVDGRTDVFALGCVIYCCLTGTTPINGKNTYEIIFKQINEVPMPVTSFPHLKSAHAIDAVMSKALEKQPERRQQSMAEFIQEIEAVQNNADAGHIKSLRLRVLQKKRLLGVLLSKNAALAIALLVVSLVMALSFAYVQHKTISTAPAAIPSYADVLASFNATYEQGKLQFQTANYSGAVQTLEKARADAESIGYENDAYFDCLTMLSQGYRHLEDTKQASFIQERHDRFLKSRINFGDESHNAQLISQLWLDRERDAGDMEVARKLVTVQNNQASLLYHRGQLKEAEKCASQALSLAEKALPPDDPQVVRAHGSMARVRKQLGKTELATQDYDKAIAVLEKTPKQDMVLAYCWGEISEYLMEKRKLKAAAEACHKEIAMAQDVAGQSNPAIGDALCTLGRIDLSNGNNSEAIKHFRTSLDMYYQTLPPGHHALGYPMINLGFAYLQEHKLDEAQRYMEQAMTLFTRTAGAESREVGECNYGLAMIRLDQHDTNGAEPLLARALTILLKLDPGSTMAHDCYNKLWAIYQSQGRTVDSNRIQNLMHISSEKQ